MSLDLSTDYLVFDDPETVTYFVKVADGATPTGQPVEYAQASQMTKADLQTNPALLQQDTQVWNLWRVPLGDITPKIGDSLEDPRGKRWGVQRVQPSDRDANGYQRYRLTTIAEV